MGHAADGRLHGAPLPSAVRRLSSGLRPERRGAAVRDRPRIRPAAGERRQRARLERRRRVPRHSQTRLGMSHAPGEAGLVRALGVVGLAASVVNITIGGGIFRAPGSTEVTGRLGAAAPLAYLVCAIAMAFVVMCFAEAGARVSMTGGVYAYVERAFGQFAGFFIGWMVWVTGTIATAAVGTIFADSLLRMLPGFPALPFRALSLLVVFVIVATINVLGVKFGARLNIASTIVKLTPLALLIVVGLFNLERSNLAWSGTPAVSDVTRASIVLLFVFAGIESALVPSGEVVDPARTVPRAVFIALAICTVFYILVHIVAQGVLGSSLAGRN